MSKLNWEKCRRDRARSDFAARFDSGNFGTRAASPKQISYLAALSKRLGETIPTDRHLSSRQATVAIQHAQIRLGGTAGKG